MPTEWEFGLDVGKPWDAECMKNLEEQYSSGTGA